MLTTVLLLLLVADPTQYPRHPLLEFKLTESDQKLAAQFDRAPQVARGEGYYVLQFHAMAPKVIEEGLQVDWVENANAACDGKFAYSAYFTADGQLQSILHQPDRRLPIAYLFPESSYRDYEVTNSAGIRFRYRVRKVDGERMLLTTLYQSDVRFI